MNNSNVTLSRKSHPLASGEGAGVRLPKRAESKSAKNTAICRVFGAYLAYRG